jgi:hypothetical protein
VASAQHPLRAVENPLTAADAGATIALRSTRRPEELQAVPRHRATSLSGPVSARAGFPGARRPRCHDVRMTTRAIDTSALETTPTRAEVQAFRRSARERWRDTSSLQSGAIAIGVVVVVVFAMVAVPIGSAITFGGDGVNPVGIVFALFFVGAGALVVTALVRSGVLWVGRWGRWLRLDRFAAANGLVFAPRSGAPAYPGAIFSQGRDRHVTEHLRTRDSRFLDLGTFRYETGSGKNRRQHARGFLAMHLDRRLPHMVLDARANDGLFGATSLPAVFDRSQRLSLEGDFDRHFTLYCPREYERDALYVLTPDLMALLIDEAGAFDLEIVDDWLFAYSTREFDLTDATLVRRLFRIVDTVGAKTLDRIERYADDRAGSAAGVVAPPGRRLRRGFSWVAVAFVAVFAITWLWSVFGSSFGG